MSLIIPIGLAVVFTWGFALLVEASSIPAPQLQITPFSETENAISTPAPYLNALMVILLMTISGILLFSVISRIKSILKSFIMIVLGLISLSVTWFYTAIIFIRFLPFQLQDPYLVLAISMLAMFIVPILAVNKREPLSLSALVYIGAAAGTMWGMGIPFWTSIVLLVGVSLFDIIMVFKGYLSSFRKAPDKHNNEENLYKENPFRGLMLDFKGASIGLGDVFFYSMAVAFSIFTFGIFSAIFASAGIIIGALITLILLSRQKGKGLPGLPIPIFMSLGLLLLSTIL